MSWRITDTELLETALLELKLKLAQTIGVHDGMTVVDVGCGQGGFTVSLAKTVGEKGRVLAVDVSDEYFEEFTERLSRHGVKRIVNFVQADAINLRDVMPDETADVVASCRFLEELKQPKNMPKIVKEMARIGKRSRKVAITELCTEPENEAEEAYIRLHQESGDSFSEPHELTEAMKRAKLADIHVEKVETNIWFSPDLAKRNLSHAQVWFDADVAKSLGQLIDKHGMKYPAFLVFSGTKE
ncbi:MAG: methyltransferase domain-containing protein [Candidatus Bathyarchaeota archaeon]|nr:methyltransferase domain-containing protein [Candidatus Bathyarchaeota archaeon]